MEAQLLPGGVADADGKKGYLQDANGSIKAVSLSSGATLWKTSMTGKPVIVVGNRLIVLLTDSEKPNVLRLLVLDTSESGHLSRQSSPVVLPEWIMADGMRGQRLLTRVSLEKELLILDWQANSFYAGGARPTPEMLRRMQRFEAGRFRISLHDGSVKKLAEPIPLVVFVPVPQTVILGPRQYTRIEKPLNDVGDGKLIPTMLVATDHATSLKLWEIPIAGRRFEAPLP